MWTSNLDVQRLKLVQYVSAKCFDIIFSKGKWHFKWPVRGVIRNPIRDDGRTRPKFSVLHGTCTFCQDVVEKWCFVFATYLDFIISPMCLYAKANDFQDSPSTSFTSLGGIKTLLHHHRSVFLPRFPFPYAQFLTYMLLTHWLLTPLVASQLVLTLNCTGAIVVAQWCPSQKARIWEETNDLFS